MIVLYILLGIVLFFALLFWMKVKVFVRLEDEMTLRAGYGPIVLTLVPKKKKKPVKIKDFTYKKHQKRLAKDRAAAEKKALKKKKKKEESDKKKKAKELEKKVQKLAEKHDGDKDVNKIAFIVDLVKLGLGELAAFPGYLHTDIKMLDITVASDEAASTAIKYEKRRHRRTPRFLLGKNRIPCGFQRQDPRLLLRPHRLALPRLVCEAENEAGLIPATCGHSPLSRSHTSSVILIYIMNTISFHTEVHHG